MVKAGFWLNLASIATITLVCSTLVGLFLGIA